MTPKDGTIILAAARVAGVLGEDHADRWKKVGSLKGQRADEAPLQAPARLGEVRRQREARGHHRRRFCLRRRRNRCRAHGARVRRGRLRRGKKTNLSLFSSRWISRENSSPDPAGRREIRQGRRCDHPRRAEAHRRPLEDVALRALIPALLALRDAAALLRAHFVVRADDRIQERHARAQLADGLASGGDARRARRRVADQQHRLGCLTRPLLGHSASDLAV